MKNSAICTHKSATNKDCVYIANLLIFLHYFAWLWISILHEVLASPLGLLQGGDVRELLGVISVEVHEAEVIKESDSCHELSILWVGCQIPVL